MNERNVAASVRARLLNRARETKQDFNLVLTRYAIERLLYRISISKHADQFLLKSRRPMPTRCFQNAGQQAARGRLQTLKGNAAFSG